MDNGVAKMSVRRLKRILLICFVLCLGFLLYYSTANRGHMNMPTVQEPRERIKSEQESIEGRTEASSEEDSIDLTQQPAGPGDKWEEGPGLDDNEELHDTLGWIHQVGTRPRDISSETHIKVTDLHKTAETYEHATVTVITPMNSKEHLESRSQDTAFSPSENEQRRSQETTRSSTQHASNERQRSQETTRSPSETPSEQRASNERQRSQEETLSSTTTSEQLVSNEQQGTKEETLSSTTTSEQLVSNEQQGTKEETLSSTTTSEQLVSNEQQGTKEETLSSTTTSEQLVSNEQQGTKEETLSPTTTRTRDKTSDWKGSDTHNSPTVASRNSAELAQEKQESDDSTTEIHHSDSVPTLTTIATQSRRTLIEQGSTAVYTPALRENVCTLPKLDPWDPSIKHLLRDVGEDPGCNQRYPPPPFEVVSNKLVTKANADTVDFNQVKVETIHRSQNTDKDFYYVNQGNPFNVSAGKTQISNVINSSDHFRLEYKVKDDEEKHVHFFARVVPQQLVMETAQKRRQQLNQPLDLNILMIGFDSTSRANFLRKMPNSLAFLRKKLSTSFFEGYSIVGDATTPALTALLTGKYINELPEGRRGWENSKPVDDWPWIMRKFEKNGYVTLFAEDDVSVGTFNLRLLGFKKPPTHHYTRPFWMAVERAGARDRPGVCSKSTSMVNYTLEYLTSFFEAYPDTLKFAFSFMSYISHAHPNHLSYADKDLLRFLTTFVHRRHHENTILIVFGDHGSRNDDVRDTMQGKLEERLPWLSISMPKWFRNKYPDVLRALAHNQHVIATPFDLHATLHHVLTFPAEPTQEKTQSLFTKLDTGRTCSDAGIDEHWCPCLQFKPVATDSLEVERIAKSVVAFINGMLSKEDFLHKSCAELHLVKIIAAFMYKPNVKLRSFSSTNQDTDRRVNFGTNTPDNPHFQVTVQTRPGNGLFEASVTIEDERVSVNPHISRINRYGDQAKCVLHTYPYARKYCFCEHRRH